MVGLVSGNGDPGVLLRVMDEPGVRLLAVTGEPGVVLVLEDDSLEEETDESEIVSVKVAVDVDTDPVPPLGVQE